MPASVGRPSTSLMRPAASRCSEGCSTSSTTTTSPGFALPRSPGGITMSWLILRFSASTNQTPRSSCRRPTISRLTRSSTSTISPSGRPRRSVPVTRTATRSPCSTLCISRGFRNTSSPPSSGTTKPKPSAWPSTLPRVKPSFAATSSSPLRLTSTSPARSSVCSAASNDFRSRRPRRRVWASSSGGTGTPASRSAARMVSAPTPGMSGGSVRAGRREEGMIRGLSATAPPPGRASRQCAQRTRARPGWPAR